MKEINEYYDGIVLQTEERIPKETTWIISKFIFGEYLEYPELVNRFGDSKTFDIVTTGDSVYINGLLVVNFGDDISGWSFVLPVKWIKELCELTTIDNI